ncbi:hypothetical protein A9995_15665 [Erythrobacter sp. QSSC1-22B]|nr:hypothetical protein A9995_15665 [Erythrobacter sp. QSSC1-22B]
MLELLADGATLGRGLAVDFTLDVEQRIEPLHGFERDGIDHAAALAAAPPASCTLDIRQLEELAPGMGKAGRLEHGSGLAPLAVKLVIAAIGIGLQDPCP